MAITLTTAGRDAMCNALVDAIDGGATDTTGDLVLKTSADAEVATLSWAATPAFGASSTGVATMNTIQDDTSATGGDLTGGYHMFQDRNNAEIFRGSIGTSGADLNISSLNIGVGDTVSCSSYTVTVPAS